VPAASDAVACSGPVYLLGSDARPVYLVPALTTAQSSCGIGNISSADADAAKLTGSGVSFVHYTHKVPITYLAHACLLYRV
jgi:hypothetical protein